jgi:hypothetical protein
VHIKFHSLFVSGQSKSITYIHQAAFPHATK